MNGSSDYVEAKVYHQQGGSVNLRNQGNEKFLWRIFGNNNMINLANKIEVYLNRKPDFLKEVILFDDGQGAYIKEWNVDGVAKPTDEQLDALSSQAETLENNAIAVANRQKEYGSIAEQIEYITENGLEAWQSKVQEIKTKYPKESE